MKSGNKRKSETLQEQPVAKRTRATAASNDADTEKITGDPSNQLQSVAHSQIGSQHKRKAHVRFGSEEPDAPIIPAQSEADDSEGEQVSSDDSAEEDEDEDAAPEDVSAATALQGAREAAAAATKAAERQLDITRKKRKEKDARLKSQSKSTAKSNKKGAKKPPPDREHEVLSSDLIPEELLADDFERAPTPPAHEPDNIPARKSNVKKLAPEQAQRDLQVGPVKVRVLDKTNKFLAPKVAQRSRDRRESWLRGRASGKSIREFARKPMNAGFLGR